MQPIDTAWGILKSLVPPEDGPARSTQTNRTKREMDRQRNDAEQGEMLDPQMAEQKAAIRAYIEQMMQGGFSPIGPQK